MEDRFLDSPEAVAAAVRQGRAARRLSQSALAAEAGVGRRFVSDLENGHPRAELGKVLAVLRALDIHATALPAVPSDVPDTSIDLDQVVARFA